MVDAKYQESNSLHFLGPTFSTDMMRSDTIKSIGQLPGKLVHCVVQDIIYHQNATSEFINLPFNLASNIWTGVLVILGEIPKLPKLCYRINVHRIKCILSKKKKKNL